MQRGFRQRGYNQGRYVIDAARNEWSEHALHHFNRQYLEHMAMCCDNPLILFASPRWRSSAFPNRKMSLNDEGCRALGMRIRRSCE